MEQMLLFVQEGKEEALYFDAIVLDSQRRRHDVRGCRCRFLVRYNHDESEVLLQSAHCVHALSHCSTAIVHLLR
jgi:hypothetical protein